MAMGRAAKLFRSRVAAASATNTAAPFVVALRCTAIAGKPLEPHPHTGSLNILKNTTAAIRASAAPLCKASRRNGSGAARPCSSSSRRPTASSGLSASRHRGAAGRRLQAHHPQSDHALTPRQPLPNDNASRSKMAAAPRWAASATRRRAPRAAAASRRCLTVMIWRFELHIKDVLTIFLARFAGILKTRSFVVPAFHAAASDPFALRWAKDAESTGWPRSRGRAWTQFQQAEGHSERGEASCKEVKGCG